MSGASADSVRYGEPIVSCKQAMLLATGLLPAGCAAPLYETEGCGHEGEPTVELMQRRAAVAIEDGSELPVFPPPQGGVFTEVDLVIAGVPAQYVEGFDLQIVAEDDAVLAEASYALGDYALSCSPDDAVVADDLPVAFARGTDLQRLDGQPARVHCNLFTADATITIEHAVVLRVTSYGPPPD